MKKIKYLVLLFFLAILFPISVNAAGNVTVSPTKLNITKGKSATFKITAKNSAGRIDIKSSNPNVASVSTSNVFLDEQSSTITVKAKAAGTTTITVVATDVTTYDDEDLSGKKYTITVTVTEPKTSNSNKNTNSNTNTNSNLSKNNNLKEISVDGYSLTKVNNDNYTLVVSNDVSSINVKATPEDSKAKITGTGNRELKIGENTVDLVIAAESGDKRKVTIKVTRKKDSTLEDLDKLLVDTENKDITIVVSNDTIVTSNDISKIKESQKKVTFYYEDDNTIYSWIVDGTKITDTNDFKTFISLEKATEEVLKSSNYASGIYFNMDEKGILPTGTILRLSVGSQYQNGDTLKLYYYDSELQLLQSDLKVTDGYIEFEVEKGSEYFITMSDIQKECTTNVEEKSSSNDSRFMIIAIIEFFIIVALLIMNIVTRKQASNKELKEEIIEEIKDDSESFEEEE